MTPRVAAIVAGVACLLALAVRCAAGGPATVPGGIHSGPVFGTAGDVRVSLDIAPKPVRAMRPLTFTVIAPGAPGDGAWLSLAMPGMSMPPNRVRLLRRADGTFRGSGTLVRCMSGRRTWTATVTFAGKPPASFTFDVAD